MYRNPWMVKMRDVKMLFAVVEACHNYAIENNMPDILPKLEMLRQSLVEETEADFTLPPVMRQPDRSSVEYANAALPTSTIRRLTRVRTH